MGLVAQANKSYGEAVARMKRAQELLHEAEKKGEGAFKPYVRNGKGDGREGGRDSGWVGEMLLVRVCKVHKL